MGEINLSSFSRPVCSGAGAARTSAARRAPERALPQRHMTACEDARSLNGGIELLSWSIHSLALKKRAHFVQTRSVQSHPLNPSQVCLGHPGDHCLVSPAECPTHLLILMYAEHDMVTKAKATCGRGPAPCNGAKMYMLSCTPSHAYAILKAL